MDIASPASRSSGHASLRVVIPPKHVGEELYFHDKCGKNVVLINDGKTAYRKDPEVEAYHGGVFTNRHLFENELFEVTLDQRIGKWNNYSFGIGITVQKPTDDNPEWLHDFLECTYYMYDGHVYWNSEPLMEDTMKDFRNLEEGDRVGVMRKDNGQLHFFVNGVDVGASVTVVPSSVYGIIDIGGCAVRASIVDSSTPLSR